MTKNRFDRAFGGNRDIDEPAPYVQGVHMDYRFLVTFNGGWTYEWVHCPVCRSENDGWTPDGKPLYSGGFVTLRVPLAGGDYREEVAACRCQLGMNFAHSAHVAYYDEAHNSHREHLTKDAFVVLWDREQSEHRPAWIPEPCDPSVVNAYNTAMAGQLTRHLRGEISADGLAQMQQQLEKAMMPRKITRGEYESMKASSAQ